MAGFPLDCYLSAGKTAAGAGSGAAGTVGVSGAGRAFRRWHELDTRDGRVRPMEVNLGRHPFDRARSRLLNRDELMHVLPQPHRWLEEEHNDVDGAVLRGGSAQDGVWFPGVADAAKRIQLTQVFTYDATPSQPSDDADFLVQVVRRRPIIFYRALPAGRLNGNTEFRAARQFFRAALRAALGQGTAASPSPADTLLGSKGAERDAEEADDLPGDGAEPMDVVIRPTSVREDGTVLGYASCHFHISERPFTLGEAAFALANDLPGFLERLNQRLKKGRLNVQVFRADAPEEPLRMSEPMPLQFGLPMRALRDGSTATDLSGARFIMQTTMGGGGGGTPDSISCLILQGPVTLEPQADGTFRAFVNGVEVAWQADWQQP